MTKKLKTPSFIRKVEPLRFKGISIAEKFNKTLRETNFDYLIYDRVNAQTYMEKDEAKKFNRYQN